MSNVFWDFVFFYNEKLFYLFRFVQLSNSYNLLWLQMIPRSKYSGFAFCFFSFPVYDFLSFLRKNQEAPLSQVPPG